MTAQDAQAKLDMTVDIQVAAELPPLAKVLDVPIQQRSGRVAIIALDAGSLELVTNATSEGRLPNFGRILTSRR